MSASEMAAAKQPSLITVGLLVVSCIFPVLSLGSILLRWKARQVSKQTFGADDWWIVASWVTTFAMSVHVWVFTPMIGINYYSSPLSISKSLQCLFLASAIVQIPLSAVKISILLFYRRIFSIGVFRIILWAVIALVACWGIVFFFLMLFLYDPVDAAWGARPGVPRFDAAMLGYAQVGSSIALDVLVLFLPIPLIFKLHLDTKRKIAIAFIFWLGSFCVIAAIVRLNMLHQTLKIVLESAGNSAVPCLPCYGPLVRGGRSQISLIHSVRSLFSLRSQGSGANSQYEQNDSQIELKNSEGHVTAVVVERHSQQTDAERGEVQLGRINVTSDVHIERS